MNKHCKNCKSHHNAGHPVKSNLAKTYNDWCVKYSRCASKAVGECKLKNGKTMWPATSSDIEGKLREMVNKNKERNDG